MLLTLSKRIILFFLMMPLVSSAQLIIPLYDNNNVVNAKPCTVQERMEPYENNTREHIYSVVAPNLTAFLPVTNTATAAVIICPGGSYARLSMTHEGYDVAKRFQKAGVAAFVLKYRLPNDSCMVDKAIGPLQDAQQAILIVRKNAGGWNIDPSKIGIMGFSAGGHLASSAGTHFQKDYIPNPGHISLRPDFMLLLYPVISFSDSLAHGNSKQNLLGKNPSPEMIKLFSNEQQVTAETPPAFLVHATDDPTVKAANSEAFAAALKQHNVPAEIHIYHHGGHGFGMNNTTTKEDWFELALDWMRSNKWLK